jgi:hypothetical protein
MLLLENYLSSNECKCIGMELAMKNKTQEMSNLTVLRLDSNPISPRDKVVHPDCIDSTIE